MPTSLAGQVASVLLGLGVLVTFASWFQMRLEENERLEKLELDELARSKGGSTLFEAKDSEVFPAARARSSLRNFFVPGFGVLLFLLEAGGAWLLWSWISRTTTVIAPDRGLPALSLFAIFALLLFLFGRFSVTIARLENNRLLRPGANFLLWALISASPRRWESQASRRNFPGLISTSQKGCACCSG